jgi:hypothetical protein
MFSFALLGLLLSFDYDIKVVGVHGLPHVVIRPGTVALSDQSARLIYLLTQEPSGRSPDVRLLWLSAAWEGLLPHLVHGDDALRLNATVSLKLAANRKRARNPDKYVCPMLDRVNLPGEGTWLFALTGQSGLGCLHEGSPLGGSRCDLGAARGSHSHG